MRRIVELAHSVALAWADAVHYGPHGPVEAAAWDVDVLICSPYKFFGRISGSRSASTTCSRAGGPSRFGSGGQAVEHRLELGTLQHKLLAGFVAVVEYLQSLGWDAIVRQERRLGERFLVGLPPDVRLHGLHTMASRVPAFCFDVPRLGPREVAERLAESRDVAVWWGNYYAVETMKWLGLDPAEGAVQAGIVHYNTDEEVDRLLAALAELTA